MNNPIKSYSKEELADLMKRLGQPAFRANQIFQWLYSKQVGSYDEMTNLPLALREELKKDYPLYCPAIVDKRISSDGTRKYVLSYHDDSLVETVGIPSNDGRLTVCFSTQVGCPMACSFCATGKEGFSRNLSMGEIIDQIITVQKDMEARVTNIVGMGQGEPFLNYRAVANALKSANDKQGLNIGARHITVSTCGIIPGIQSFSQISQQFTLAVSLHAAIQKTRDSIMPQVARYPLSELKRTLLEYTEKTNRRVTLEYIMMKGVNDSSRDLEALIEFTRGLLCHVNLIPLNSIEGSIYIPSPESLMLSWIDSLSKKGTETTIRHSRGGDIAGACGQLKCEGARR